jgi:WD40 repeat protein
LSTGKLAHVLARHSHPLTAVAFQPGNMLLATASHDRVHIWTVNDGQLVKTFRSEGEGGVNDLQFDAAGRRLAITYADGINYVIPFDQTIKS